MSDAVLDAHELAAVARLWKAGRRAMVCRFGGTSMQPAIPERAEVRLQCGEGGALGDVVAFLERERVIVHRVVAASARGWLLTRGDARLLPDRPLASAADLVGRVAAVRVGDAFAELPPARPSLARALVLRPLVALMRTSPSAGTAVIGGLHQGRRAGLLLAARLRSAAARLRGRAPSP